MSGAVKHDAEKPRVDLIPFESLEVIGEVLGFGAKKYGAHNWTKGMEWHRLHRAAIGHIGAWSRGENLDPESRLHHLAHASCCLLFLLSYHLNETGTDDRRRD